MSVKRKNKFFDLDKLVEKIRNYLPDFDEKVFKEAFEFANSAHKGQMRKDAKTPYIVHPVKVVEILADLRADSDVLVSALLHDVPEDTQYTIEDVEKKFGKKIAFLVDGITKLSKVHYRHNMPERQIQSLKKLFVHSAKDLRVILIKLADRLHNMRTLEYVDKPEKRSRIAKETLEIYVPIANLIGIYKLKEELEDLCFKYLFPEEYQQLEKKFSTMRRKYTEHAEKFIAEVSEKLKEAEIGADIFRFKKGIYRAYKKLGAQGKTIKDIKDRITIRIVVGKKKECYETLGIIHELFTPKPDRFKDFIAHPKINGYKALHTVVFGIKGVIAEVQIVTREMWEYNEMGIAAGYFYNLKNGKLESSPQKARSDWLKRILEIEKYEKDSDDFIEHIKLDVFQDRIVVFTPRGDAIDLPRGASAIDLAYAVHSEIGRHGEKALVNGKPMPITHTLRTGDVVKVVTNRDIRPQITWLSFAKTNQARNKILIYLKRSSKNKKLKEGRRLLQREFDVAGLGLFDDYGLKSINKKLSKTIHESFKSKENILIAIAEGRLKASEIVRSLANKIGKEPDEQQESFEVGLQITATDRPGLLGDVVKVVYKYVDEIVSSRTKTSARRNEADINICVKVKSLETVSRLFEELEHSAEIQSFCRISYKNLYWFYGVALLTAIVWAIHPVVLRQLVKSGFKDEWEFLTDVIIFAGLSLMAGLLLYLSLLVKKSFPLIRDKGLVWFTSFLIATVGATVVFSELLYYSVNLGWVVAAVFSLVIYAYLGLNYFQSRKRI